MNIQPKVIFLAGGYDQIAFIAEFRKRGYYVVLLDYNQNPLAKEYADSFYQVSTLDIEAVREIAIMEKIDLITTACTDQALLSVAKISEELGLPCYLSYKKALKITNKLYMKREMNRANIPTAKHITISSIDEVDFTKLKFPLVVKPTDCNSSKGVKKVLSIEDSKEFINEALELSRSKTAIIEEFIEGFEISVDVFISDGKAEILLITESEKIKNSDGFTITKSKYPVNISSDVLNEIRRIVQLICTSFNILSGPLLVQMLISENEVFVVEFSARMGGGTKYRLIEALTGFNIMMAYVDFVTGVTPKITTKILNRYAIINYCYANNGIVEKLVGFDELLSQGVIDEFYVYKVKGELINKAETSSDRVAGYLITSFTPERLRVLETIANDAIKIVSSKGEDIMKHNLI